MNLLTTFRFSRLSLLLIIVFSALISACGGEGLEELEEDSEHSFMNITLNGTAYNELKPLGYFGENGFITGVSILHSNDGERYLHLQGDHAEFQVNLRMHESLWKESNSIIEEGFNPSEKICYATLVYGDALDFDIEGVIEVTKFDMTNRVITGNFEFSSSVNKVVGTFDYPLDAEDL